MIDLQKLQKQIKSHVKTLLIVLTAFATLTLVLSTVQTFKVSERRAEYQRELSTINDYAGNIAKKISYMFELTKMCKEYNLHSGKTPQKDLPSYFYQQFLYYVRKKAKARIGIEANAPKIRTKIGEKASKIADYFILLTENYSDFPPSYCKEKQYDWRVLKKKQHEFSRLAKAHLKTLFKDVVQNGANVQ